MKRIGLILFLFMILVRSEGQTIFRINQYNIVYKGDFMPVFTLFTNSRITRTLSVTGYFYVNAYPKGS